LPWFVWSTPSGADSRVARGDTGRRSRALVSPHTLWAQKPIKITTSQRILEVRVSLSELPPPVAVFLDALATGDWATASAQCEPTARVVLGPDSVSNRISSWAAGLVSDGPLLQRPLFASDRAGSVVVVTLIPQCFGALILDVPQEYEWCFLLYSERIRLLTVSPRSRPRLPAVVADLVHAVNLLDLRALMSAFAPEARVVSRGREYRGRPEIRGWADLQVIGRRLTICVQQVSALPPSAASLRCICDGDFPRQGLIDPVVVDFDFRLRDARIAQLVVRSGPGSPI
jgi:hypothetical protein